MVNSMKQFEACKEKSFLERYNNNNTKIPKKRQGMISEVRQMQKAKAKSKGKKSLF